MGLADSTPGSPGAAAPGFVLKRGRTCVRSCRRLRTRSRTSRRQASSSADRDDSAGRATTRSIDGGSRGDGGCTPSILCGVTRRGARAPAPWTGGFTSAKQDAQRASVDSRGAEQDGHCISATEDPPAVPKTANSKECPSRNVMIEHNLWWRKPQAPCFMVCSVPPESSPRPRRLRAEGRPRKRIPASSGTPGRAAGFSGPRSPHPRR